MDVATAIRSSGMKQAVIAILVGTAGVGGLVGVLGARQPPLADAELMATTTIPMKPAGPNRTSETVRLSKSARITATETGAIQRSLQKPLQVDVGVQPIALPSQDFLDGIAALSRRDAAAAIDYRDRMDPSSVDWQTLGWSIAVSGQVGVPSSLIADVLTRQASWPGQSILRENFEEALFREAPPAESVVKIFASQRPTTPEGSILLARAALSLGDRGKATGLIRELWIKRLLDAEWESRIIDEFGTLLVTADHKARMDFLLFRERYDQAKRFAELGEAQSLHAAFQAVGRKSKSADSLIKKVDAKWKDDPALLYVQIKRLRQLRQFREAARLLETIPDDPGRLLDPGAWWVEARVVTRGLIDDGRAKDAYRLAAAHVAHEPDDIVEAEFHAGWYALRELKDPKKAAQHFQALLAASPRAGDRARAYFWLGRAAEASKQIDESRRLFRLAADYPMAYYGQLAASRLGIVVEPGSRYQIDDGARLAFAARPEVLGIGFLEQAGEPSRARRLYLALAARLEKPVELQLLAEKALASHGPVLALAIGKAALKQGHDAGFAAFPLGAIPDSANISGAGKALAYAIARQESAFNPAAVSPANARGLLQLLPATARRVAQQHQLAYADEKLIEDPAFNATLGSHYLGEQINRFNGSLIMTFAAYNAGPNRIPQWIARYGDPRGKDVDAAIDWVESIPFTETRDYVQRVMENYQVYKMLLKEKSDIAVDLTAGG